MTRFTNMTISGLWLGGGVSEDCSLIVGWRNTNELPNVLGVEECYGVLSGTNYLDKLIMSPTLRDHLRDMICEMLEV